MGIPKFAKTLMTRYPLIIGNIKNESDIPPIDNLYLDLNSTIHELSHSKPDNLLALFNNKSDTEIFRETCEIINQIVELIRPKSLLMIALDGVSPIAKIGDQLKSRHNKSFEYPNEINQFLSKLDLKINNNFERNKISPCTDFMLNLEKYLDEYIQKKVKDEQSIWKNINIILSGTNVPGEGEYKIMEQIREEKIKDGKNDLKYCIFSGDADFILLSLLIHEPNIIILKGGNSIKSSNRYNFEFTKENNSLLFNEFIYISVLREYLDIEFCKLKNKIKFQYNIEHFCDDFAFLCLLLGNDFIPPLINLDNDGKVYEILLNSYKNSIIKCNDYLTNNGIINFQNFKIFINELSLHEEEYLNMKYEFFKIIFNSRKNNKLSSLFEIYNEDINANKNNEDSYNKLKYILNTNDKFIKKINILIDNNIISNDKECGLDINEYFIHNFVEAYNNDKYKGKRIFYKEKFNFDVEEQSGKDKLNKLITHYLEGLQWNLYYFKGLLIWNWNYIYDYCPLLHDMAKYDYNKNISEIIHDNINQKKGKPLPPYILQCLIFSSFNLIPSNYHQIKEIIPYYYKFKIIVDNNGFLFPSQMTTIVPKIEGNDIIEKLIEFDKSEFGKTPNYNLIKEIYGKEYIYRKNNNNKLENHHMRNNEIFNENYDIKKVDIMFPSIESIDNYKYIEGYFNRNIGGNKIVQINSLFISISLDEKKYKKINKIIIDNIFKEKIISYGYPLIKLGVLNGLYYNNKYYTIDNETKNLKEEAYQFDYEEQIRKDYEYVGLKILKLSCLIEVIPIIFIDNGISIFDYDYKFLIPLEITSLNIMNNLHQEFLKQSLKLNNIIDVNNLNLDKKLIEKEKEVFLYDESLKKNKNNETKEKSIKNKMKNRDKKGGGKRKKPVGPSIEREITNFKFKNLDNIYF